MFHFYYIPFSSYLQSTHAYIMAKFLQMFLYILIHMLCISSYMFVKKHTWVYIYVYISIYKNGYFLVWTCEFILPCLKNKFSCSKVKLLNTNIHDNQLLLSMSTCYLSISFVSKYCREGDRAETDEREVLLKEAK